MKSLPDPNRDLFSVEAEMSVLGAMLLSERAAEEATSVLTQEDFYRPAHGLIFGAMSRLVHKHRPIDTVSLEDELKSRGHFEDSGGPNYILELANYTPSASNSNYYAQIVLDKSTLRKLERSAREILGVVHDTDVPDVEDKVEKSERLLFEVGKKQLGKSFTTTRALAKRFTCIIDEVVETGTPLRGLQMGFPDLDRLTSGFYPGDLIIIGARPSMGKTALALDFAINVAEQSMDGKDKGAVAIFSLEMSEDQLYQRMTSMSSGISMNVLKTGKVTDYDYRKIMDASELLYEMPIYINDSGAVTPSEMRGLCRRLAAEKGLKIVIVDYLQLMKGAGGKKTENKTQEVSEITRALKSMGKELGCPVVVLSQLNRSVESRENKRPQLSDLRDSGSIEQDADMVMFLYRDAYYKAKEEHREVSRDPDEVEEAEVIIAKHRGGPTGVVKLGFQAAYTRYKSLYRGPN